MKLYADLAHQRLPIVTNQARKAVVNLAAPHETLLVGAAERVGLALAVGVLVRLADHGLQNAIRNPLHARLLDARVVCRVLLGAAPHLRVHTRHSSGHLRVGLAVVVHVHVILRVVAGRFNPVLGPAALARFLLEGNRTGVHNGAIALLALFRVTPRLLVKRVQHFSVLVVESDHPHTHEVLQARHVQGTLEREH